MLSTAPSDTSSPPHAFLPKIPSPLSPRSTNIYGSYRAANFTFMSEKAVQQNELNNAKEDVKSVPFSKRAVRKAPSPRQDDLKERRRSMFLRKITDGREERRFESRGEDIMRLDFVQRQKQWEAQLAREAPLLLTDSFEDEDDEQDHAWSKLPSSSNAMQISEPSTQQPQLEDEAEEIARREREEMEALLAYMPQAMEADQQSEHMYSDDDDYDVLFSELMEQDNGPQCVASHTGVQPQSQGEAMDMS